MEEIDEGIAPTEQIWPEMAETGGLGRRPEQRTEEATGWSRAAGGKWGITPTQPARSYFWIPVIPGSTGADHPVLPGPESLRAAELLRFRARYYRIPPGGTTGAS